MYGLGALLYFAITGQNPRYFREQDVPVPLRDVVVKALATDREQRWQSTVAFNEALHHIQTKTHVETPTVKTTWRCKWCDAVNPLAINSAPNADGTARKAARNAAPRRMSACSIAEIAGLTPAPTSRSCSS